MPAHLIHGDSDHPLWGSWNEMVRRCTTKTSNRFKTHGARGIRVCERWMTYQNFKEDMFTAWKRGLQIERVDNNGHYEPANCRWATALEQARNRRTNVFLEFRGERKCLAEWVEILGLEYDTIQIRLKHGWSVDDALTKPRYYRGPLTRVSV